MDDSERAPLCNPTAIRNRCRAWRQRTEQHTGHGDAYLAAIFSSAAGGAAKTGTFLGERHRRVARRRSSKRAIVASGRSILANAWHLLSNPDAASATSAQGSTPPHRPERRKRNHIRQLEAHGYTVTLQPAA